MEWPYFCFLLLTHRIVDGQPIIDYPANPNFGPIRIFWMQQYWLANPWIALENYGLAGQLVDWPPVQWIGRPINRLAIHYTMGQK